MINNKSLNNLTNRFPKGNIPWNKGLTKEKIIEMKARVTAEKEAKFGLDVSESFNSTMKKIHETLEDIYDRLDELDHKIILIGGSE